MTKMREYWANVYVDNEEADLGNVYGTRKDCAQWQHDLSASRFRIHVRLKPEGAPKRYASEANRRAWERHPDTCRCYLDAGYAAEQVIVP